MRKTFLAAAAAVTMAFGVGPAFAAYPGTIAGTWNGFVGQTATKVSISMLTTTGACREFSGSVAADGTTVLGYYCPGTGRINFTRMVTASQISIQNFTGNLAQVGSTNRMAGFMIDLNFPGNEAGWNLTK